MIRLLTSLSLVCFYVSFVLFFVNVATGYLSTLHAGLYGVGLVGVYALNMFAMTLVDQAYMRGEIV